MVKFGEIDITENPVVDPQPAAGPLLAVPVTVALAVAVNLAVAVAVGVTVGAMVGVASW